MRQTSQEINLMPDTYNETEKVIIIFTIFISPQNCLSQMFQHFWIFQLLYLLCYFFLYSSYFDSSSCYRLKSSKKENQDNKKNEMIFYKNEKQLNKFT